MDRIHGTRQIKPSSIAEDRLSFDVATQAELDAGLLDKVTTTELDTKLADYVLISSLPAKVFGEEPLVTDGSTDVTLANAPTAGTLRVYLNGARMAQDAFTLTGSTLSFTSALVASDVVIVDYEY